MRERHALRRLIPRSPLWFPGIVLLLHAIALGFYYFPHSAAIEELTLPNDRMVFGDNVSRDAWHAAPEEYKTVYLHTVFGTMIYQSGIAQNRGFSGWNQELIRKNSISIDRSQPTVLAPGFTVQPVFFGITPSFYDERDTPIRCFEASTGAEIPYDLAVALAGLPADEAEYVRAGARSDWGDVVVAFRVHRESKHQSPGIAWIRDGRTKLMLGSDGVEVLYDMEGGGEGCLVLVNRPPLATDDLELDLSWYGDCPGHVDVPAAERVGPIQYEPGEYTPVITYIGTENPANVETEQPSFPGQFTYIQVKTPSYSFRGDPDIVSCDGKETETRNSWSDYGTRQDPTDAKTFQFKAYQEKIAFLRFYFDCSRHHTHLRLPKIVGAVVEPGADPDIMNQVVPASVLNQFESWEDLLEAVLHSGGCETDSDVVLHSEHPDTFREDLTVREVVGLFLTENPQLEIEQRRDIARVRQLGGSFTYELGRFPVRFPSVSFHVAVMRCALAILGVWVVLATIRACRVGRLLREKGYVQFSARSLAALYLTTGSVLRQLPPRDEAASLPDVDVESWRSLRRFVIEQEGRK